MLGEVLIATRRSSGVMVSGLRVEFTAVSKQSRRSSCVPPGVIYAARGRVALKSARLGQGNRHLRRVDYARHLTQTYNRSHERDPHAIRRHLHL